MAFKNKRLDEIIIPSDAQSDEDYIIVSGNGTQYLQPFFPNKAILAFIAGILGGFYVHVSRTGQRMQFQINAAPGPPGAVTQNTFPLSIFMDLAQLDGANDWTEIQSPRGVGVTDPAVITLRGSAIHMSPAVDIVGNVFADGQFNTYTRDFVPQITGTGFSMGNATRVGKYFRFGDYIFFDGKITFGSTTVFGTDNVWAFSLPEPIVLTGDQPNSIINGMTLDSSAGTPGYRHVYGFPSGPTDCFLAYQNSTGTTSTVGATQPYAFANGDFIRYSGKYRYQEVNQF